MFPLPEPLHPAVVHLPPALAAPMPALALLAALAIRFEALPSQAWAAVVAALGVLAAAARVGHSGGELVYRYGAAHADVENAASGLGASPGRHDRD